MDVYQIMMDRWENEKEYLGNSKPVNQTKPKVSICTITYQHIDYIDECIQGLLMQETDFPYEIIIGEDGSTDGTREKCIEYAEKYPDKIRLFLRDRKTSQLFDENGKYITRFNGKWTRLSAQGEYVAICEGDDYWIDPLKLQKQVDALDKHPEINICSHPSKRLVNGDLISKKYGYWGDSIKFFSFEEVLMNFAKTAPMQSIMFRNKNKVEYFQLLSLALGGHSVTQIYFAFDKGLIYLPDEMSVYRVASSSSTSKSLFHNKTTYLPNQLKNIKALKYLNEVTENKYSHVFKERIKISGFIMLRSGYLSLKEQVLVINEFELLKKPHKLLKSLVIGLYRKFKT